jgi:hypothetical protein
MWPVAPQLLGVLLQEKVAFSAGALLSWVLQRPELLNISLIGTAGWSRTLTGPFYRSAHLVTLAATKICCMAQATSSSSSSSMGTYAAAMTQQLEQSGALHACRCSTIALVLVFVICTMAGFELQHL